MVKISPACFYKSGVIPFATFAPIKTTNYQIKNILTKNGNRHFKTYEVPGVNHLFQHCQKCGSVEEYLALEETFDNSTLLMIGEWIKEQVK